jgi:hypothetical protein
LEEKIIAVLETASADNQAEGMTWYADVHELAAASPVGLVAGAGTLAALAPLFDWDKTVAAAQALWAGQTEKPLGVMSRSWATAQEIATGADPYKVFRIGAPARRGRGEKTRNFFRNIVEPTDPEPVAVDRHAAAIVFNTLDRPALQVALTRAGGYERVADAYRSVAEERGLIPNQVQAITWLAWRDRHYRKRVLVA